jgi:hypothetical protein
LGNQESGIGKGDYNFLVNYGERRREESNYGSGGGIGGSEGIGRKESGNDSFDISSPFNFDDAIKAQVQQQNQYQYQFQ